MSIRFRFDWVDAQPSPDGLARHTMAALSIDADGAAVTSVLDRLNRTYRDHVVVPLLSVAEWLVGNWWHLFHEIENRGEQKAGFEARHDLSFAGDGFVLPSLTMAPASDLIHLRWRRYRPAYARIEFVDEGETTVEREDLETQFRDLIDAVLERLRGNGLTLETLDQEWSALNALAHDEREFSRAAALLGVDPFDVSDSLADAIVMFWERIEPSIRDDALAAASVDSLSRVSDWLSQALADLEDAEGGKGWADVRQALPRPSAAEPWSRGYDLARSVRHRIGLGGDSRFDFAPNGSLALHLEERPSPSARIQGVVAGDTPACVLTPRGGSGRRFLLARALGDYLGRFEQPGPAILSSLATERQAQSRAFAAELLAPAESLRRKLKGRLAEPEQMDELGLEYGVSTEVIRRQIENHGLATVVSW